jgi:hypothetical protein
VLRQNRPTPENISRPKPLKEELPSLFSYEKEPGQAFRQQEQMVGWVTLVCDYRIGEKSACRCSCQYFLAISANQSIKKW